MGAVLREDTQTWHDAVGMGFQRVGRGNAVTIVARIGAIMLLGTRWGQAAEAATGEVRRAAHSLTYGLASVIVRFALAACVMLVIIYLVQLFWQRPKR